MSPVLWSIEKALRGPAGAPSGSGIARYGANGTALGTELDLQPEPVAKNKKRSG